MYYNTSKTGGNMATKALTKQLAASKEARKFIASVYIWMSVALLLSGLTAFIISKNQSLIDLLWKTKYTIIGVLIFEIALVWIITLIIEKIPVFVAATLFIFYALINGVSLSAIFIVFKLSSITSIFMISALMFICMSIFGAYTKSRINSFYRYFVMAFFGLVIAAAVNYILKLDFISMIISVIAVFLFIGLTIVETQKIIKASELADDSDKFKKAAIYGALQLYIDFIGIFLNLLKLLGREKD